MADTITTVDATPQTEVLTADEQDSLEVGEKLVAEHEGLLAGKYKNPEDLEKAYLELQGKLGEPKQEVNEESLERVEEEEVEKPESDFLDRLWNESNTEYTDATMQELSKMDPKDLAQMHLQYRSQNTGVTQKQAEQLKAVAGGDEKYTEMLNWAGKNLDKGEIDMYDAVMTTGNADAVFFAIQALKYRFEDASGVEGEMLTGKAPSNKGDQFKSNAQLIEAMNDPKYDKDPAYRREVMQKLERSNIQF